MPALLSTILQVGSFLLFAVYCFTAFPRLMDRNSIAVRLAALFYFCLLGYLFSGTGKWQLTTWQEIIALIGLAVTLGALNLISRSPRPHPSS